MFYWTSVLASETYSSPNFILYNIANSILCIPIPTKVFYSLVWEILIIDNSIYTGALLGAERRAFVIRTECLKRSILLVFLILSTLAFDILSWINCKESTVWFRAIRLSLELPFLFEIRRDMKYTISIRHSTHIAFSMFLFCFAKWFEDSLCCFVCSSNRCWTKLPSFCFSFFHWRNSSIFFRLPSLWHYFKLFKNATGAKNSNSGVKFIVNAYISLKILLFFLLLSLLYFSSSSMYSWS